MKKQILFILILILSLFILYEIYHISLVIIYGFPANAFLLFFFIIFILIKNLKNKYPILNAFIQLRLAFISMMIALSIVCFLAPVIILYSNKFEYELVLNCELGLIKLRDKFISLTGLNWEVIFVLFFILIAISFLVRKDYSKAYSTYSNFVNSIIVFLFILTSFSLTSQYFIVCKAKNIYHDLKLESQELDEIILDREKFILSCRIIEKAFKIEDFQTILLQENLYNSIKQDSSNASKIIACYISNYFDNKSISYQERSISKKKYSHSKLLEIKSKNSAKLSKLVFLDFKQNFIKSNTINLLTDILNKIFQTQQTSLFKTFANSLINDLNSKLSYELIAFSEKNKRNIIKMLNTYKFQLFLTKLSFRKTYVNNIKFNYANYASFMQKYKIPKIKPKFRWFKFRFR